jgi:hypothetical protein
VVGGGGLGGGGGGGAGHETDLSLPPSAKGMFLDGVYSDNFSSYIS